jgi:protein-tyrosine-phosphatase
MKEWCVRATLLTAIALTVAGAGQSQSAAVTTPDAPVLFICEHGTVKSLMAKLLFERYAAAVGLNIRAESRGSAVEPAVPAWMQANIRADGFTLGTWKPAALTSADLRRARYVVSFDVPSSVSDGAAAPRVQWDSLPAASQHYAASRDAIASRVRKLVDSLAALKHAAPHAPGPDWTAVDAAMGRTSVVQSGDVHRYNVPRSDLSVIVSTSHGDVTLKPALALGGWIAMHTAGGADTVMAMGDLVLTERELSPVISALQAGGVSQTALHHHVIGESPRVLYMHVHAVGSAAQIARTLRAAIALTGAPTAASPAAATNGASSFGIDTAAIARALGRAGRVNGGVYQVDSACHGTWHGHQLSAHERRHGRHHRRLRPAGE